MSVELLHQDFGDNMEYDMIHLLQYQRNQWKN